MASDWLEVEIRKMADAVAANLEDDIAVLLRCGFAMDELVVLATPFGMPWVMPKLVMESGNGE